jgi:hypothetical protein
MRRLVLGVVAASVMALGSAANAAVTVTSSTNLTDPNPCCGSAPLNSSVSTIDGTTTIEFGLNPTGNSFTSTFTFMTNEIAGTYNFFVGTSTGGTVFDNVVVSGGTPGTTTTFAPPNSTVIQQFGIPLLANTAYTVTIGGTSTRAAAGISGNLTIEANAVPEPATWAMMLLGFAGMGLVVSKRRRPVLAQLA